MVRVVKAARLDFFNYGFNQKVWQGPWNNARPSHSKFGWNEKRRPLMSEVNHGSLPESFTLMPGRRNRALEGRGEVKRRVKTL